MQMRGYVDDDKHDEEGTATDAEVGEVDEDGLDVAAAVAKKQADADFALPKEIMSSKNMRMTAYMRLHDPAVKWLISTAGRGAPRADFKKVLQVRQPTVATDRVLTPLCGSRMKLPLLSPCGPCFVGYPFIGSHFIGPPFIGSHFIRSPFICSHFIRLHSLPFHSPPFHWVD